ncbi:MULTISPECIES: hypothetical protein [Cytobacillus]|nr:MULTISPECIES: hypothetical protein [Cytobacillus]MED3575409.1 hypothetical protein [Cytobacillus praedii]
MSDESMLYKQAMIRIDELVEEVMQICDEVAEKIWLNILLINSL